MKLSDLFWFDTVELPSSLTSLSLTNETFSRSLAWAYTKPRGPIAIYGGESREDDVIVCQTRGDKVDLKYFQMDPAQIEENLSYLFKFGLSEEANISLVKLSEMASFFNERSGLTAVCVDEAQKGIDLGVPVIVLPKHWVSPDRIIGIEAKTIGTVSKTKQGVGLFLALNSIRSAYIRR
jgi:hypothetical protein